MIIKWRDIFLTQNLDVVLDFANITPDGGFFCVCVKIITENMYIV